MKPFKIIPILALLPLFVYCSNSQKKEGETAMEALSASVEANNDDNTPTDVRCFGLKGDVEKVLLSLRESSVDSEEDAWESNDSLNMAFDENGRIVRDNYENIYQYDKDGKFVRGISEKTKMKRDEKGRVVFYENWMDEEDDQGFTTKFEYDDLCRMVKINTVTWEPTYDIVFTYTDDHIYPDRVNTEAEDEGDHYSNVVTFTYKAFDSHGNWTERECLSETKHTTEDDPEGDITKLKRIEKRKISYYSDRK